MKARGTLLMALPNKDQLKFHAYKDEKLLMEAIKKRYGGNKESKKVQRTLLKQQYENFVTTSSETIDQTFDRLQKLISQLEIQGERNKVKIETICLDDLYNNLKIYESEIKGSTSTNLNSQNMAFVSSHSNNNTNTNSSTNEADNTAYGVINQPDSPQLAREDLEQIDPDDLEEMDLHWEMAMLTIRARRFIKRTGRKIDLNGQIVGFDKSKVECFNCHKNGHFARDCRFLRNQEIKGRDNGRENVKDNRRATRRKIIILETPTENALIAQDRVGGYDWIYQTEEEQPTNFALMAYASSGSSSSSDSEVDSYSKSCVKAFASLKEQYDSLNSDYNKSQFNLLSYKTDNALDEYKQKLDKAKKERDELKQTLEKFQNSSKSLNNLLESQITNKYKTRLGYNAVTSTEKFVTSTEMVDNQEQNKGYHAVPLPYTGNFIPSKPDIMFLDEVVESEHMDVITVVTPNNAKKDEIIHESVRYDAVEPRSVRKNNLSAPIIKEWNSDDESEVDVIPRVMDNTVRSSYEKIKFIKSACETVEKVRTPTHNKQIPRGNQRNWNNLMSQRLGSDFKMVNKACYACGKINIASASVDTAGISINTANRPVNTAGLKPSVNHPRPISNVFKRGYSQKSRPSNRQQQEYKQKGVFDSGCSRHMTGNKCFLSEYEDHDGGLVCFGDGKGRISGKGKIKLGTLVFDDVYFCKELKYNLFSVSQIPDKKNNVLFTKTKCLVLSSNFKLPDESQVLLRVLGKDNIYSVDLKSVVPTKGLTCLLDRFTE
ncbi:putative ribonuclease H-like domain-containing protein [Tanacetum coccineum]